MKVRTLILNLLTLMPISSVAFAAGSELSALSNRQDVTVDQVADLFDKRFFSNEFYNEAAGHDIGNGNDLKQLDNQESFQAIMALASREIRDSNTALSGTHSPE